MKEKVNPKGNLLKSQSQKTKEDREHFQIKKDLKRKRKSNAMCNTDIEYWIEGGVGIENIIEKLANVTYVLLNTTTVSM